MKERQKVFKIFRNIFFESLLTNLKISVILFSIVGLVLGSCWAEAKSKNAIGIFLYCFKSDLENNSTDSHSNSNHLLYRHSFFYILHCILGCAHNYLFTTNSSMFKSHVYQYLIKAYMDMGFDQYHTIGAGKINSFVNKQADSIIAMLEKILTGLIYPLIYLIIFFCDLFTTEDKDSTPLARYILVIIFSVFCAYFGHIILIGNRKKEKLILAEHSSKYVILDILKNYSVVKAFNKLNLEIEKLSKSMKLPNQLCYEYNSFNEFSVFLFRIVCLVFIVSFILLHNLKSYLPLNLQFYSAIFLIDKFKDLKSKITTVKSSLDLIFTSLVETETCEIYRNEKTNKKTISSLNLENIEIDFKEVSVEHDGDLLFKNMNLKVNQGDKIAITGRNGSGKSTIFKILLGFQEYNGCVTFNENDLANIEEDLIRNFISYVPQEPHLFNLSVIENLKYGKNISNEDVIEICKKFNMHSVFKSLKDGYETIIGQDCRNISGGQAQMINFMRAAIKDGPIFLLDEPTSNLDHVTSEMLINEIFENLTDKTVFFTTHNPAHLERFDKIINVHNNEIAVYNGISEFSSSPFFTSKL